MTSGPYDFIVIANRLPVDQIRDDDGTHTWRRSPGGLVTALHPIMQRKAGAWIGWHGQPGPAPTPFTHDGIRLHPIALSSTEVDDYYEGQSNATIWPLYHDAVEHPVFHRHWRQAYRAVNQRFAVAAAALAAHGATVWVHDYHLQLVPGMLRELRPDLRIGFFLHIPFPPMELFSQMPLRTEILGGLLGADLVGFQHPMAARNFIRLTRHMLGARIEGDTVHYRGRATTAAAFPISIDTAQMEGLADRPDIRERAEKIRYELGAPRTMVLAVDRLDYTKGIEHRLTAFGELLAEGRLSAADTVLVQVAVPSRQQVSHYQTLRHRVEHQVSRINGEHSDIGRLCVHYLFRGYPRDELAALYRAADVMAVTPLRDGMNLVAKEYVATRTDNAGALVLSEFAGAAAELRQAYLTNPHDIDDLKGSLERAATAPAAEQRRRIAAMRAHLRTHDVNRWAADFLERLERHNRETEVRQPALAQAGRAAG